VKVDGKPDDRNGHVRFDVAGDGNQVMVKLVRHSERKRRATDRLHLKPRRHSLTLLVCAFEHKEDAERYYNVLGKRLRKFGLEVAEEKTKIINFDRFNKQERKSFEFLGFEFKWGVSRNGKTILKRQTAKKKLKNSLAGIAEWIRENRSMKLNQFLKQLNAKLRGYYNYYGIIGNYLSLQYFFYQVILLLKKWLNRRSQKSSYNWQGFNDMLEHYRIEKPRITEKPAINKVLYQT
jgi:RNA-directed DNA polymerase